MEHCIDVGYFSRIKLVRLVLPDDDGPLEQPALGSSDQLVLNDDDEFDVEFSCRRKRPRPVGPDPALHPQSSVQLQRSLNSRRRSGLPDFFFSEIPSRYHLAYLLVLADGQVVRTNAS